MLTGSVLATAIVGGATLASGSDVTAGRLQAGPGLSCVVTLTSVFIQPDYGITVTPESAVINGGRKRVIDWRDIADISVENRYGYRTVVIKEFSGQSFRLLAPSSFSSIRILKIRSTLYVRTGESGDNKIALVGFHEASGMTRLAFFRPPVAAPPNVCRLLFMPSVKERLWAVLTDEWRPGSLE